MKNAILKSISATNFGPFNGTITFDMETSVPKGQIIDNHTFIAGDNQQFNKSKSQIILADFAESIAVIPLIRIITRSLQIANIAESPLPP